MQTLQTSLTCGRLRIRDFKRIELLDLDLSGNHLLLSGPNGSGKSSVLEALLSLLGLIKGKDIPEPIRKGTAKAELDCDLIDKSSGEVRYTLHQEWEGEKRIYTVHGADGKPVALREFQKQIDQVLCNPLELLEMRNHDQLDEVLRVFGIEPPVDQVREITGESHPVREGESAAQYLDRLSADQSGVYYDRRRNAHRLFTQKSAAFEEERQQFLPQEGETDGPSISELLDRRKVLEEENRVREEAHAELERGNLDYLAKKNLLEDCQKQLQRRQGELAELLAQVEQKKAEIDGLLTRVVRGERVIEEAKQKSQELQSAFAAMNDPRGNIKQIDQDIQLANQQQKIRQKRELQAQNLKRLEEEVQIAESEYTQQNFILEQLRQLRRTLLEGTDFGIAGLEIGSEELRFNGVSFKQASLAQKIDLACAIAFRRKPGARIVVIDNGEHLDSRYRDQVIARATEQGCQLCLAVVRDGDELQWQIVN